jgi:hypothetical protein
VPEGVHAVFAGSLMAFARLRRGNDPSRDRSGLPRAVIEVGPSNCTLAIETGEQQPLRDWQAVRPEPRQGDLDRRERLHALLEDVRHAVGQRDVALFVPFRQVEDETPLVTFT